MSAPRHLWSGNWQSESDAAAQERANRGADTRDAGDGTPPEPTAPAARAHRRRLREALAAARAQRRRLRVALLAALVTLLSAGVAYTAVSLLSGSGGQGSAQAATATPWLGVEMASSSFGGAGFPTVGGFAGGFATGGGVLITEVVPGSPAAAAGLERGDVLTQIGNRPVATPADVQSALAGLRAGDQVQIQYAQGAMQYTTQVTLAARPAGYP
jgi:C-terminal processing protease CtpA/Prc